jgi:ABC-type multidrug transport system ATPase subunit
MELCGYLKKISDSGATVITVIHQPSYQIFRMFDNLMLLHKGKLVYYGLSENAKEYFENYGCEFPKDLNPVDMIMDFIKANPKLSEEWKGNLNFVPTIDKSIKMKKFSIFQRLKLIISQFIETFKRSFLQKIRNVGLVILDLFLVFFAGFVMGGIFYGSISFLF